MQYLFATETVVISNKIERRFGFKGVISSKAERLMKSKGVILSKMERLMKLGC